MIKNMENNIINRHDNACNLVAVSLAISPILDPYVLSTSGILSSIHIMDIISIICIVYAVVANKMKLKIKMEYKDLFTIILFTLLLSLISFSNRSAGEDGRSLSVAFRNIIAWTFYSIEVWLLWSNNSFQKFMEYAKNICVFATVILFYQYISSMLGVKPWNGQIPIFPLSEYDTFGGQKLSVRARSVFQEPSYYGIYAVPNLLYSIKKKRYPVAAFIGAGILVSTSMLSIIASIILVPALLIVNKGDLNYKNLVSRIAKVLSVVFSIVILIIILYNTSNWVNQSISYIINRYNNMFSNLNTSYMNTSRYRITGYSYRFSEYSDFFKTVGVGANQYARFLNIKVNYSNNFVTILLDYGIIGEILWIIWNVVMFKRIKKENRFFLAFFIIVSALDKMWFNWYFFYLITWFIDKENNDGIKHTILEET